jgi:hypothetical protein
MIGGSVYIFSSILRADGMEEEELEDAVAVLVAEEEEEDVSSFVFVDFCVGRYPVREGCFGSKVMM